MEQPTMLVTPSTWDCQRMAADLMEPPGDGDEVVVLAWTGGFNAIYADWSLRGVELAAFDVDDGSTLADDETRFKDEVRRYVARVLCGIGGVTVAVYEEEAGHDGDATLLFFAQELSPDGGVGEGEYDPCNRRHDNTAIVFAEQLVELGDAYPFEDWVRVFGNVAAHEIAHTLGFGHVARDVHPATGRSLYTELMLDAHTMEALRRPQRMTAPQTNCPGTTTSRVNPAAQTVVTCYAGGAPGS